MSAINDPLLMIAKIVLAFLMGVLAFVTVVLIAGAVAAPIFEGSIVAELIADGKGQPPAGFVWLVSILLIGIAGLLGLLIYFLLLLWRIVGTVGAGDPFVPENAARLSRMGWVAVAGNILALFVAAAVTRVATVAADMGDDVDFNADIDFGGGGLLLILVLFILARVFRHGAAMREDLEGTV
ncbi:DUF2975 domain-containing protein [Pelagerythrobacter marensis]|uniref:DUF2975 domain-containing protein n=1 Tax=Pelagerythrobacter marensis TaxID=543877 RepID=A0A0G3XBT5_9SPHN|nr:DUF2975 domain-containing protein [Pelagerythrobacter marensis]AKM08044.1 hypothetical protein AM2010_1982 [Pelagerythrobacter marensis]